MVYGNVKGLWNLVLFILKFLKFLYDGVFYNICIYRGCGFLLFKKNMVFFFDFFEWFLFMLIFYFIL